MPALAVLAAGFGTEALARSTGNPSTARQLLDSGDLSTCCKGVCSPSAQAVQINSVDLAWAFFARPARAGTSDTAGPVGRD